MDFSTLQATVAGQYDAAGQAFAFAPAPYASPAIAALLATAVGQDTWRLTGAAAPQPDAAARTVTVAGTADHFYGQDAAPLAMVFFLDDAGEAQLLIQLALGAGWRFATAFPELADTVFDELAVAEGAQYVFASVAHTAAALENGTFAPGLNFYGSVAPASSSPVFGPVMRVLGEFVHTTAVGPLSLEAGTPTMRLTLGVQQTLAAYVPLLAHHVLLELVCLPGEAATEVGLRLSTTFAFGASQSLEIATLLTPMPLGILTLVGTFTGVALPTPGQFAQQFEKLIGANDLYDALPTEYQGSTSLLLKTITVGIGTSSLRPVLVALEIGMPADDPGWQLGTFATVSGVTLTASVQNPFDAPTRLIALGVSGALALPTAASAPATGRRAAHPAPLRLGATRLHANPAADGEPIQLVARASAEFGPGQPAVYAVQAGLQPGTTLAIPAGTILNKYLPAAVNLPDITLAQLGVDFKFGSPKNRYALYAGLDPTRPLQFTFGGAAVFEVLYANFHIESDSNAGGVGGGLVGGLRLFGIETDFEYQAPGDFKVTTQLPAFDVSIKQLADGLLPSAWALPDWLPVIPFPQTSLYVQRQGSGPAATYTFALLAQPSWGAVVVQVLKQAAPAGWAFAGGLQLRNPKIATFDSLQMLAGMDNLFKVNELVFVFTSANLAGGFQFPLTSSFAGGTGPNVQAPDWVGALKAGFYFYGSMTLNIAQQESLKLVPLMLGLPPELTFNLLVFIGLQPTQNALAQASISGNINATTSLTGTIGARMEAGEPKFYLEGVVRTTIDDGSGHPQALTSCQSANMSDCLTAGVAFELTPNAAFLSVSMIGSVTFGPVTLSNLVVVVGISLEGIPSLGFAAQIDLQAYGTSYDSSIAFFFDSGDPAKSLFAGSISDVTLKQIADTVVGAVTGGDTPPAWLDDLLAEVGVSGTDTFWLPATAATALNAKQFDAISAAFQLAAPGGTYAFSQPTTLLVVGETALNEPGTWFITDYSTSNVVAHYELHTEANGTIRVSLEPQFFYCLPPGGGTVTLGPPSAGLTFNSGVFLAGQLDFFMVHLAVKLAIVPNQGFAADLTLTEPLVLVKDLLSLTGNADPSVGPYFSVSTYPVQVAAPAATTSLPAPGKGKAKAKAPTKAQAKPRASTKALALAAPATLVTKPAHFYLDGKVDFLGLHVATTVNVTAEGLQLDFQETIGSNALGGTLAVRTALSAATGFSFDILGSVHINAPTFALFDSSLGTLNLHLDIAVALACGVGPSGAFLQLKETTFAFGNVGFTIPGLTLSVSTQQLTDLPGIVYDAVQNLIWDFLRDAEHWLEWVGGKFIDGVKDIEQVLNDVYNAVASVWGNEKRIVVAVSESFAASQSTTITLTPAAPTPDVTQAMLDAAQAWAAHMAEFAATQAIIAQVKQTSPDDVGNFEVSSVQSFSFTYELRENVNWFLLPGGPLPSLTALGFKNPFADARFYNQTTTPRQFQPAISVDADFSKVARVTVTARYQGTNMGSAFTFTNRAAHSFKAPWDTTAGENFEVQYVVAYLNGPQVTTGWLPQQGSEVQLLIGDAPAPSRVKKARRPAPTQAALTPKPAAKAPATKAAAPTSPTAEPPKKPRTRRPK